MGLLSSSIFLHLSPKLLFHAHSWAPRHLNVCTQNTHASRGCWSLSQLSLGARRGTPWTDLYDSLHNPLFDGQLWIRLPKVEKNEEADQKIEQDGTPNKPEDKAHKAATKIQASFRGHITRKKMKDGEEEKDGDSPAAENEATDGGEETKKAEGEEAPAKQDEVKAEEEAKKEEEETNQAKSPAADKPANSPAAAAAAPSPVAAAPAATAPSEPQKEEPKVEEQAAEKPKEVEAPAAAAKSPTAATAEDKKEEEKSEEKKKEEEARQADVPAAVSPTAEKEEPNQTKDKQDAAAESKAEEAAPAGGAAEATESKDD
ncbi:neuromodulin isoform 1-T1 [Menidia menidia]